MFAWFAALQKTNVEWSEQMAFPRPAIRTVCPGACSLVLMLAFAGRLPAEDVRVADASGKSWVVTVTPRLAQAPAPVPVDDGADAPAPPAPGFVPPSVPQPPAGPVIRPNEKNYPVAIDGMTYQQAYASIPYRRHEYLANPSYRHEAAMELLFGKMRPTTINKQVTSRWVPEPELTPYRPYIPSNSDYWTVPRPVIGLPYWYGGGLW